jgi:uncharacterized protein YndB with AHSA1/START domain
MRLVKGLFLALVALAVLFFAIGLFLPRTAHIERSVTTTASPAEVYELVAGFKRFNEWSPWANIDPTTKYTYRGPESGVGARLEWTSAHPNVGSGSQEIIDVEPGRSVTSALDFGMDNPTTSTMVLVPEGSGTRVTWTLDTDVSGSIIGRYFGLALDRMVGPYYEKGLAQLQALAESTAAPRTDVESRVSEP